MSMFAYNTTVRMVRHALTCNLFGSIWSMFSYNTTVRMVRFQCSHTIQRLEWLERH